MSTTPMNVTNPNPQDVQAALRRPPRLLDRIAAPFIQKVQSWELESLLTNTLKDIASSEFQPIGRLKHVLIEPDEIPVENQRLFKEEIGLPTPMIVFPQEQRGSDRTLRGAPTLGTSRDDRHVYITSRIGFLPEIVDPRAKIPAAKPLATGGAAIPRNPDGSEWEPPMVRQRPELLARGTMTLHGGLRYWVIGPVTAISVYGIGRSLFSISFQADRRGRKTDLLIPIVQEMPGRARAIGNWPAFFVWGQWRDSTNESRGPSFAEAHGFSS